jgi:hypothetical protein
VPDRRRLWGIAPAGSRAIIVCPGFDPSGNAIAKGLAFPERRLGLQQIDQISA